MRLITQKELIRNVANNWNRQYSRTDDPDKIEIYKNLCKLDPISSTIYDVEKIIGNKSWTQLRCNECECERKDDNLDVVVEVGEEPDYDSSTATLCEKCLKNALKLFKAHSKSR